MPEVDVGDAVLHVEVDGEGSPVMVLAHGLTNSCRELAMLTPFVPGTLIVFVDGIAHATVVEHPASGSFGLGWAPEKGSSLEASWRER